MKFLANLVKSVLPKTPSFRERVQIHQSNFYGERYLVVARPKLVVLDLHNARLNGSWKGRP